MAEPDPYRAEKPLAELIPPDHRRRNTVILVSASCVVGAALLGLGQQLWAVYLFNKAEETEATTAPARLPPRSIHLSQPMAGSARDVTSRNDGPIAPDGFDDEPFDVIAEGPFVSLLLLSTDSSGRAMGGQQWDTVIGNRPIPRGTKSSYSVGESTSQLAVFENNVYGRNTPDGSLSPLGEGRHELRIYASGSGWFKTGRYFRLFGELADGSVVESNVLSYDGIGVEGPLSKPAPLPVAEAVPAQGQDAPFDRGAAAGALGGVNLQSCRKASGPTGSGHVKVVFLPSGVVASAEVDDSTFKGTPTGGCVARMFRTARVPPFGGGNVTVGKSFTINSLDAPF